MTVDSLQRDLSVSKRQALTELYIRIKRFTPCCPPETRGGRHMLILLCDALKGETWAEDTCSLRFSDENITFAKMYGKIAAIITDKLQKGPVVDSNHESSPVMAYPVSYGQRFAKTPDDSARSFRNQSSGSSPYPRRPNREALPNDTCLRCKRKGHWAADCKYEGRLTITEAIAARLPGSSLDQLVKVLFQFSSEFDASEQAREENIQGEQE
jgi:hypothetical protein